MKKKKIKKEYIRLKRNAKINTSWFNEWSKVADFVFMEFKKKILKFQ